MKRRWWFAWNAQRRRKGGALSVCCGRLGVMGGGGKRSLRMILWFGSKQQCRWKQILPFTEMGTDEEGKVKQFYHQDQGGKYHFKVSLVISLAENGDSGRLRNMPEFTHFELEFEETA